MSLHDHLVLGGGIELARESLAIAQWGSLSPLCFRLSFLGP
jgi:hypothetical protein